MDAFTDHWVERFSDVYDEERLSEICWVTGSVNPAVQGLVIDQVVPRGSRLVDLGCGPGVHAVFFAQHGMDVTAVDRSTAALARGRELAAFYGAEVTFLEGDILDVPVADASADVVHDSFVYHNVRPEVRERYVAEVARVVRPGGLAVLTEFSDRMTPGTGPLRLTSDDMLLPWLEHFEVDELRRFRSLPTEKRPDQWHWLAVYRRRGA
ncbi:hypothetical protein Cph01nite_35700 [Cellulomonas phragmiteti]|uniref:Methyltransferase domain-containing protein n=2 Tax=Cellulomonas phragmiteti TaxID=478780 RepID=A0ABQ4DR43_9CELL|nr:hypothetical protein Cph01nite_35700 [Cellulomonas phragmiteti]